MKFKQYTFTVFILVAVLQLMVPLKMVYSSHTTETEGTLYKFRTAPIDPNDPFRGKYVALDYEANTFTAKDTTWETGQDAYLILGTDKDGFAYFTAISHTAPKGTDYIEAQVKFNYDNRLRFNLPFDRYYMNENKAAEAESSYREYNRHKKAKPAYALVAVKDGNAVLKDVIIGGMPIKEYVEQGQLNR